MIARLKEGSGLVGDFNGDGKVGFPDFLTFAGQFGKSAKRAAGLLLPIW